MVSRFVFLVSFCFHCNFYFRKCRRCQTCCRLHGQSKFWCSKLKQKKHSSSNFPLLEISARREFLGVDALQQKKKLEILRKKFFVVFFILFLNGDFYEHKKTTKRAFLFSTKVWQNRTKKTLSGLQMVFCFLWKLHRLKSFMLRPYSSSILNSDFASFQQLGFLVCFFVKFM